MVFCNLFALQKKEHTKIVTILILIDGFLQYKEDKKSYDLLSTVTILILIDGFLQLKCFKYNKLDCVSHNPYFNRWFSAIYYIEVFYYANKHVTILILIDGFLQYLIKLFSRYNKICHNPYFNRWFSAIYYLMLRVIIMNMSQSLF